MRQLGLMRYFINLNYNYNVSQYLIYLYTIYKRRKLLFNKLYLFTEPVSCNSFLYRVLKKVSNILRGGSIH